MEHILKIHWLDFSFYFRNVADTRPVYAVQEISGDRNSQASDQALATTLLLEASMLAKQFL